MLHQSRLRGRLRARYVAPMFRYTLAMMLLLACGEKTPKELTKGDRKLLERNLLKSSPTPKIKVDGELGDKVVYLGLDAPAEAQVGRPLKLVHYWRVKNPVGEDWKLFVHLVGVKKAEYANADHVPIKGRYPVDQWKAGDIIRDEHTVTVPRSWKAEWVEIYVGLWRGDVRLPVVKGDNDGENRLLAARIPLVQTTSAQADTAKARYLARRRAGTIEIDGALGEDDWVKATPSSAFVNTMTGDAVEARTQAKMLWDDQFVYVAFEVQDNLVESRLKKHDDRLWTQDVVEMFIDADADGKDYIELQVSPAGVTFDSYLPEYRKNQNDWESGFTAAVKVDGSLNQKGADQGYSVEMKLPVDTVRGRASDKAIGRPGEPGTVWRINWFCMDGMGKEQKASGWSPPLVGDFHQLDKFGELRFIDQTKQLVTGAAVKALRDKSAQKILREKRQRQTSPP